MHGDSSIGRPAIHGDLLRGAESQVEMACEAESADSACLTPFLIALPLLAVEGEHVGFNGA